MKTLAYNPTPYDAWLARIIFPDLAYELIEAYSGVVICFLDLALVLTNVDAILDGDIDKLLEGVLIAQAK